MLRRRDLIVPIRDRRQRRRYLTLKNFGIAVIVSVVGFAAISIRSEMRDRKPGQYGSLFEREVQTAVDQKPVEVVREAPPPVDDHTHADPFLTEAAVRAQWLEGEAAATATAAPVTTADIAGGSSDVAIVGGPGGVTIVKKEPRRRPVLSGGFGR